MASSPPERSSRPSAGAVTSVLLPNVLLGLPAYAVAWFYAYAFNESITVSDHASFLILIVVFALAMGFIASGLLSQKAPGLPRHLQLGFCLPMSVALNLAVVCLGSIVSALNKDQGSVSAGFSPLTDALIAIFLATASVALARVALSTLR